MNSSDNDFLVNFSINFRGIRVIENRLLPTLWNLKAEVIYDDTIDPDDMNYHLDSIIAFAKIKFWIENIVDGSVMINRSNVWAQRAFLDEFGKKSVDNQLMLLPEEPTDATLADIFQSKMNALAGNILTFGAIEVTSDDYLGLSYVSYSIGEFNLPTIEEWIGERSYFSKPWWGRDDASMIDVIPEEDDDLNIPPAFAFKLDFISESMKSGNSESKIVRPEFRPEIIHGGKKD